MATCNERFSVEIKDISHTDFSHYFSLSLETRLFHSAKLIGQDQFAIGIREYDP